MAGFVASEAVEPLDYDFSGFVDGSEAKGTVPEPSQQAMAGYRKAVLAVINEYKDVQDVDPNELESGDLEKISERAEELEKRMDELTARLCKNTPSVETLAKLPWRHKLLFSRWLQEQFNPGKLTGATSS
jgi:CBS-domain-containing membrane protein